MAERIQKVLARAGVASRRAAEQLVRDGRVSVNGAEVRLPGTLVDAARDVVAVDGRPVELSSPRQYYLLNKPPGYLSTALDRHGRPTVLDLVPASGRLFPVGRLDLESEGLLLLTDDGELANQLTHPRFEIPKEYHVLIPGPLTHGALERLRSGVILEEGRTATAEVEVIDQESGSSWLCIVLRQGWKRQVRRMLATVGQPVRRLIRVRIGAPRWATSPAGRSDDCCHLRSLAHWRRPVLRQIIALDGPAEAGNSTVGIRLAAHLGWLFVDTGLFYRVLTQQALQHGASPSDEPALMELARGLQIRLVAHTSHDGNGLAVWVNGSEVTAALRTPAVEAEVSAVAALAQVRAALIEPQRSAVGEHAAVVAGRDIGTVIFEDAGLKIYLDASPTERARRRRAQLAAAGESLSSQRVLEDLERRDRRDSSRADAPLAVADDALPLCTDGLSIDDVVARILELWYARAKTAG